MNLSSIQTIFEASLPIIIPILILIYESYGYLLGNLSPSMDLSSILTIAPILISAAVFIYTLYKDRLLRRKEYADKIRTSAGTIIAKLERWETLSLRFFEDIEPILTKTDINLVKRNDFDKARYDLWMGLEKARSISSQRIVDEQVEMAYIDLYGYNPTIEDIFSRAVRELKIIDKNMYDDLRKLTQADIIQKENEYKNNGQIVLGELGIDLRTTCGIQAERCKIAMDKIIEPFRNELLKLIKASDEDVVRKDVKISRSEEVFKNFKLEETEISQGTDDIEIIRSLDDQPHILQKEIQQR